MPICINRSVHSSTKSCCTLETCNIAPLKAETASCACIQVEIAKRERLLASAEIDGLKKYHFKEVHGLQDQLLTQRAAASKLTMQLQQAVQVASHVIHMCQQGLSVV